MNELYADLETFLKDYPELYDKLLDELYINFPEGKIEDLDIIYYWAVLNRDSVDLNPIDEEIRHLMVFEERLNYEKDKIYIEVYFRYDNYIRGQVVNELPIPELIINDLKKVIASTMKFEQTTYNEKDVIDSIPDDIETYDLIEDALKNAYEYEEYETLDADISDNTSEITKSDVSLNFLLDKIKENGIESLSVEELECLKKYSE